MSLWWSMADWRDRWCEKLPSWRLRHSKSRTFHCYDLLPLQPLLAGVKSGWNADVLGLHISLPIDLNVTWISSVTI